MKKEIATIGLAILTVASISSLLVKTKLIDATMICVDKRDNTNVDLPCSNPNVIDKNSLKTSQNPSSVTADKSPRKSTNAATPSTPTPAKIQLLFFRVDHTGGYIFTTHYVVWGRIANTGGTSSKPTSVQIACTNTDTGAPLYSRTIALVPSALGPGDIGTFSQPISSDDLQGTKYHFSCTAQPTEK
jgi:hypothetical protein